MRRGFSRAILSSKLETRKGIKRRAMFNTGHRRAVKPLSEEEAHSLDPPPSEAEVFKTQEPTFFPRLQIYFADFPYTLFTKQHRLLTSET